MSTRETTGTPMATKQKICPPGNTEQQDAAAKRRPDWLRVKVSESSTFRDVRVLLEKLDLNTVCQEARCPNIWECWGIHKTATFMILGAVCTRHCLYCSVEKGSPSALDFCEPEHVAKAIEALSLSYVVITSVTRDDLTDYGAAHFSAVLKAIRQKRPEACIELLVPDFKGDQAALATVLDAGPNILGHNTETVPRLFAALRPQADYAQSLRVLEHVHVYRTRHDTKVISKSGLMLGLGETTQEILDVMDDLRQVHCDVLTLGQYLNPTRRHAPVKKFYTPDEFESLKQEGLKRGFKHVESGPLVRSSYHAHMYGNAG